MKFSEKWLRQLVNPKVNIETIAEQLCMAGIEVASVTPFAQAFSNVVVGEVIETSRHPNADKLSVCKVKAVNDELLTIVCGAANVRVGLKVAVALVGAQLPDGFKIKVSKIRGVESFGMLCSAKELGLKVGGLQGILELPTDASLGANVYEFLQLDDCIMDVEFTPNRGDCLSILGLAREIAALNKTSITEPELVPIVNNKAVNDFQIDINATVQCPRYCACIIKGINLKLRETPDWIIRRLEHSGLRAINLVVDITNYVMLELGQPLHAFDLDTISSGIIVRFAKENESLTLLDGKHISLATTDLIIADHIKPLALAGIMGGVDSGVNDSTCNIMLESAFFTPSTISASAKQYNIQSDSSYRFERGVDPMLQLKALHRAVDLLKNVVGGEVLGVKELTQASYIPKQDAIELHRNAILRLIGIAISDEEVTTILRCLNMQITSTDFGWKVLPPSYRFDLSIEEDLVEEVARIYGYNNVPEQPIFTKLLNCTPNSNQHEQGRQLKTMLTDIGYNEIITYSFTNPKLEQLLSSIEPIILQNPISPSLSVMRTNLWSGLINTAIFNFNRQQTRVQLFEYGLCFCHDTNQNLQQTLYLGGLVSGDAFPEQWGVSKHSVDFFDVKNDVVRILEFLGYKIGIEFKCEEHVALHPACAAGIYYQNKLVGRIGQLHPNIVNALDMPIDSYLFDLNLSLLFNKLKVQFKTYSKYPSVTRDIAFIADKNAVWAKIRSKIIAEGGKLLHNVNVFDIYCGANVEKDCKSIAVRLVFQHFERTLRDEEVDVMVESIVTMLERNFNARLRG